MIDLIAEKIEGRLRAEKLWADGQVAAALLDVGRGLERHPKAATIVAWTRARLVQWRDRHLAQIEARLLRRVGRLN